MSKIIKEGELPVKRVMCDYCGCEFEYDKRDVAKRETHREYLSCACTSRSITYDYSVACPYCHTSHTLPADILDQLKSSNPLKDFMEDAKALAAQYGYEIENIDIKHKDTD
ncbi:MAG: hypothetical protein NC418_11565 [Muribaculaceae bacterium]|nr:hypothetical protein [Muribaculaceae bacterium]